ncbi:MAG: ROK family transcriptional regulator [Paracoccaceae bacterium]
MKPDTPPIKRQHLHDIRINNRSRILQALRSSDAISRQELAKQLDLTPASLSRISKELIADGICIEAPITREGGQRGRPGVAIQINPKGGYLIAISISSFSRLISIIDLCGTVQLQQEIPKQVTLSGADTVAFISDYIDGLVRKAVLKRDQILGASFTIPGSINVESGFLTKSILLNWPDFPIKERLVEKLRCPVRVENNGDALCRHYLDNKVAIEKDRSNIFLAHVSEGMGASIAIGGRIVRRLADEGWINDLPVFSQAKDAHKVRKLSQIASGKAILADLPIAQEQPDQGGTKFSQLLQTAVSKANQDCGKEHDTFFDAGRVLGANLVTLTVAIAPETIVLAGPVLQAHAYSKGVQAGYEMAVAEMDIQPSRIVVSGASYIDASESLALHDYFLTGAYSV